MEESSGSHTLLCPLHVHEEKRYSCVKGSFTSISLTLISCPKMREGTKPNQKTKNTTLPEQAGKSGNSPLKMYPVKRHMIPLSPLFTQYLLSQHRAVIFCLSLCSVDSWSWQVPSPGTMWTFTPSTFEVLIVMSADASACQTALCHTTCERGSKMLLRRQ